jgi:hypothetical protein
MDSQPEFFKELPQSANPWRDFDTPKRPPKKSAPGWEPGAAKLQLIKAYRSPLPLQACFFGWQHEAARLFSEFWRTGGNRHLAAFVTHVVAMRGHVNWRLGGCKSIPPRKEILLRVQERP